MARTKLKRLSKVKKLPNVFSFDSEAIQSEIQKYFESKTFFTLEIGCGHGDYSVGLAKRFPAKNFIGIDVKGARVFRGAMKAIDQKLNNVGFIVGRAENLKEVFHPKSIEEIYILFPEPHVRRANQNRRLISDNLLKIYKELLTDSGTIHFKTDNQFLFDYALKVISGFGCRIFFSTENINDEENHNFHSGIKTSFEEHYIKEGRSIKYICFGF